MYQAAPAEKQPAPRLIGPAPDEEELTPVYLAAPMEKEPALPGDRAST